MKKLIGLKQNKELNYIFVVSVVILFLCSTLRHFLFKSNAFDLGIFDQGIYLISEFKDPFVTLRGLHILGDHGAWIHYFLALPYIIFPSVHWLFLVQSISLGLGVFPAYDLAIEHNLKQSQAYAVAFVYLLYPVIFNANLFDFHPEVIAVPLILYAILFAYRKQKKLFSLAIVFILGCKAVLSLTVIGMGGWLLFFRKQKYEGCFALVAGIAWFIISTKFIIPNFSGYEVAGVSRYGYLGGSLNEIILNFFLKPHLLLGQLFSPANLEYLIYLLIPAAWGLSKYSLVPLIGALPCIGLNLLSSAPAQKNLVFQYSLPAIPFLILAVIATLSFQKGFLKSKNKIIAWSVVAFLIFAKPTYFTSIYLEYISNLRETHHAINLVKDSGGVFTNSQIAPHLSHRELIDFPEDPIDNQKNQDLERFKYILLNVEHPGWANSAETMKSILTEVENNPAFTQVYAEKNVFLFLQED